MFLISLIATVLPLKSLTPTSCVIVLTVPNLLSKAIVWLVPLTVTSTRVIASSLSLTLTWEILFPVTPVLATMYVYL